MDVGVREIQLTKGLVALVDVADFDWLSQWKWSAREGYAIRTRLPWEPGTQKAVLMHRVIAKPEPWQEVDHINRSRADNRRINLRACTRQQNQCNMPGRGAVPFKGVVRMGSRFRVLIKIKGVNTHVGMFDTADEAARAYDRRATEHHGEFAFLNFAGAR